MVEIGEQRLLSFQFKNLNNENEDIKKFKGSYTLISIWATWCEPCLYAIPFLSDIYEKYRYDGLKVVSISLDGVSALEKWKKTLEKENMYWYNYILLEGFNSDFCQKSDITSIPHYVLLDPDGRIMLENAPGPSDPNLTFVLDRLLKSQK